MNFRFSLFSLLVLFSTSGIFADDNVAVKDATDEQEQSACINKTAIFQTVLGALTLAGQLWYLAHSDANGFVASLKTSLITNCFDGYKPTKVHGLLHSWLLPVTSIALLHQGITSLRS